MDIIYSKDRIKRGMELLLSIYEDFYEDEYNAVGISLDKQDDEQISPYVKRKLDETFSTAFSKIAKEMDYIPAVSSGIPCEYKASLYTEMAFYGRGMLIYEEVDTGYMSDFNVIHSTEVYLLESGDVAEVARIEIAMDDEFGVVYRFQVRLLSEEELHVDTDDLFEAVWELLETPVTKDGDTDENQEG